MVACLELAMIVEAWVQVLPTAKINVVVVPGCEAFGSWRGGNVSARLKVASCKRRPVCGRIPACNAQAFTVASPPTVKGTAGDCPSARPVASFRSVHRQC